MEKRMCLACGEPVVGRSDKRFCHDACRNAYNNKRNSLPNSFMRKVNDALKRNRQILVKVLGKESIQKVSRDKLLSKGFNFDFFTNQFSNAKGQVYFFVYEYGYLPLKEDLFLIVRQKTTD